MNVLPFFRPFVGHFIVSLLNIFQVRAGCFLCCFFGLVVEFSDVFLLMDFDIIVCLNSTMNVLLHFVFTNNILILFTKIVLVSLFIFLIQFNFFLVK